MTYLLAKQEKQQQHHKRQRPETLQLTGSKLYEDFMDWQKSEAAHENYTSRLRGFMTFLKISEVEGLLMNKDTCLSKQR